MTIDMFECARNIYSASGGAAHPSAVSAALYGLLWNMAWDHAAAAGQAAIDHGATWEEAQRIHNRTLWGDLGFSDAEVDAFLSSSSPVTAEGAQQFDEAWDTFDAFIEHMRRRGR